MKLIILKSIHFKWSTSCSSLFVYKDSSRTVGLNTVTDYYRSRDDITGFRLIKNRGNKMKLKIKWKNPLEVIEVRDPFVLLAGIGIGALGMGAVVATISITSLIVLILIEIYNNK